MFLNLASINFQGARALERCTTLKILSIYLSNNTFVFSSYLQQGLETKDIDLSEAW